MEKVLKTLSRVLFIPAVAVGCFAVGVWLLTLGVYHSTIGGVAYLGLAGVFLSICARLTD